jgi:hypothetical protein
MKVLLLSAPLLLVIVLAACIRVGGQTVSPPIEKLIHSASTRGQWSSLFVSKYFAFKYPPGSKMAFYSEAYGSPGSLESGLSRDFLYAAMKLANEKYGLKLVGININSLPDERKLNLYFFDPNTAPQFAKFRNQCVYVGFKNSILRDALFLRQFSEIPLIEKKLDGYLAPGAHFSTLLDSPKPNRVKFLQYDLAASHYMVLWALMHEMGHMVHGHKPATQMTKFFKSSQYKLRAETMEREADQFAMTAIESFKDRLLVVNGVRNVATGLIATALNAADGVLPVPLTELNVPIPVASSEGAHPPMLIRLLDAMMLFEKTMPDVSHLQNPTFKKLRSQVVSQP